VLNFFHTHCAHAVEYCYLRTKVLKNQYITLLANYFLEQPEPTPRKLSELPLLLYQASDWPRLRDCLLDLDIFCNIYNDDTKFEIIQYWRDTLIGLGRRNDYRLLVDNYRAKLEQFELVCRNTEVVGRRYYTVAEILRELAENTAAEEFYNRALKAQEPMLGYDYYEQEDLKKLNFMQVADTLDGLGWLYSRLGRYTEAEYPNSIDYHWRLHGYTVADD
jgi:hypothetical protein